MYDDLAGLLHCVFVVAGKAAEVREAEPRAFPAALELVASGAVRLGEDGQITWKTNSQNKRKHTTQSLLTRLLLKTAAAKSR